MKLVVLCFDIGISSHRTTQRLSSRSCRHFGATLISLMLPRKAGNAGQSPFALRAGYCTVFRRAEFQRRPGHHGSPPGFTLASPLNLVRIATTHYTDSHTTPAPRAPILASSVARLCRSRRCSRRTCSGHLAQIRGVGAPETAECIWRVCLQCLGDRCRKGLVDSIRY